MPSYIIHYICGNKLLDDYQINTKEKNLFLAANLIPDTSKVLGNIETASSKGDFRKNNRSIIQQEKLTTHFRDSKDSENIYMFPNPEKFKEKYGINDLISLGYYYHLYTDKYFFSKVFPKSFEFLTDDFIPTTSKKEVKYVKVYKNNKIIPVKDFYSSTHLYRDYTILNKLLLDYYNISFDEVELKRYINEIDNYIEEVDFRNLNSTIKDILFYIAQSKEVSNKKLEVFDKEIIIDFINDLTERFISKNKKTLKKVGLKKC